VGLQVHRIDPGLNGALAVLAPHGTLEALWDTPTLTLATSRGTHGRNTMCLASWLY
jgi:hypothetical protein